MGYLPACGCCTMYLCNTFSVLGFAGGGLAYLTYKRPRAVLIVGGTSALFSTAVLYSTIGGAVQAATRFAENIAEAASSLEMDSSDVTSWS